MAEGGGCIGPPEVSHGQTGHAGGAEAPGADHSKIIWGRSGFAGHVRHSRTYAGSITSIKIICLTGDYNCSSLLRDVTIEGVCLERSCLPCRRFPTRNGMW